MGEYLKGSFKSDLTLCKRESKVQDQNESQRKALISMSVSVEWFLTFIICSQNEHVNFYEKNDLMEGGDGKLEPGIKMQKVLWSFLQNGEKCHLLLSVAERLQDRGDLRLYE